MLRRVIVEVAPPERPALSGSAVDPEPPPLPGVAYDRAYPAVWLRRSGESTYVVRGACDEDELDRVLRQAEASPQVVGVFADVRIEEVPVCGGSGPVGTAADVAAALGVEQLRAAGMDGEGVYLAVVDTGVNLAYLRGRGLEPAFDAARSWAPEDGLVPGELAVGHGTMVAYDALIAAPRCTLVDVALLQSREEGETVMSGFLSDAVRAYAHLRGVLRDVRAVDEGAAFVVTNSWGMFHPRWDFPVDHPGNYSDNPDHPFNRIVETIGQEGADLLFAAGNCGADCPDRRCEGVTDRTIYGANSHPQVLCVGAVTVDGERAGYSAIGPGRLTDRKPDLCGYSHFAGSGVYPADAGTSAATPVVAGLVAALRSRLPVDPADASTSPAAVRDRLRETATDAGPEGFDYAYGWGIADGAALLETLPA